MKNPRGTVVEVFTDSGQSRAVVAVEAAVCSRCAAGRGCGAGVFSTAAGSRQVQARIAAGVQVAEGDRVELTLAPDRLLDAAWVAYGIPLAGALAGASLAWYLQFSDSNAALAVLAGVLAGGMLAGRRLTRDKCLQHYVPIIERRLAATAART